MEGNSMSRFARIRSHARQNIVGYLALFVALGGTTAYAAGLADDSVKSRHIVDGQVRGADLRDDGVTGTDVKESTLAPVPNADRLGELEPSELLRGYSNRVVLSFAEGQLVSQGDVLAVPGVGIVQATCLKESFTNLSNLKLTNTSGGTLLVMIDAGFEDPQRNMLSAATGPSTIETPLKQEDRVIFQAGSGFGPGHMLATITVTSTANPDGATSGCGFQAQATVEAP